MASRALQSRRWRRGAAKCLDCDRVPDVSRELFIMLVHVMGISRHHGNDLSVPRAAVEYACIREQLPPTFRVVAPLSSDHANKSTTFS
jgi:hypothetical protein